MIEVPGLITPALLDDLRARYRMDWNGVHGYHHWLRVCENGLRLSDENGADHDVVILFAFTHDIARMNDGWDHQHGPRASEVIRQELSGRYIQLPPERMALLVDAVAGHTQGGCQANLTVQTCWDADRLDLGRVGIRPDPARLCTPQARRPEVIEWAWERSQKRR